jgi:hypothetical protein
MGALADKQLGRRDALSLEIGDLLEQHGRIDHHAAADHIDGACVEDTRRYDM